MENKKCGCCGTINWLSANYCKICGKTEFTDGISHKEAADKNAKMTDIEKLKSTEVAEQKYELELREESTSHRLMFPITGFFLTLITFGFVSLVFTPEGLIYRLLVPSGAFYLKLVPFLIVFFTYWSFCQLLIKLINVRKEKILLREKVISDIPYSIQNKGVKVTLKEFTLYVKNKKGNLFRMIYPLLKQLESPNGVLQSHDFLKHQAEIHSDHASSGYTTVRIFIWAMPILGFIGTVMGISLAVGDFSGFLRKSGGEMEIGMIREQLSNVATGLSYAFDTTLLGLVASLFTMFFASFLQKKEEGFLTNLESLCLRIISNFTPEPPHVLRDDPANNVIEPIREELKSIENSINNFNKNFNATVQELSNIFGTLPALLQKEGKNIKEAVSILESVSRNFKEINGSRNQVSQNVPQVDKTSNPREIL